MFSHRTISSLVSTVFDLQIFRYKCCVISDRFMTRDCNYASIEGNAHAGFSGQSYKGLCQTYVLKTSMSVCVSVRIHETATISCTRNKGVSNYYLNTYATLQSLHCKCFLELSCTESPTPHYGFLSESTFKLSLAPPSGLGPSFNKLL
jgi:hypothetical protein